MIRVLGIGGDPGTGKSLTVRTVLDSLPSGRPFCVKISLPTNHSKVPIRGTVHDLSGMKTKVFVLGVYDDQPYPGTDRLSMAAPAVFLRFLEQLHGDASADGWVLFEGQRFFSKGLI